MPAGNYFLLGPAPAINPSTIPTSPATAPLDTGAAPHDTGAAPLDEESAGRLRAIIGRLSRQLRTTRSGTDAGLSPTRISLLLVIDRRGPMRPGEVADAEGLNPTMLSRSVTQLVDAGLLERTTDDGDRRAAWVRTTPAGHALAERMRAERTAAVNVALGGLDAATRRTIEAAIPALESLAEALREARR